MYQWLPGCIKRNVKGFGAGVMQRLREWTKPDAHGMMGGLVADGTRSKTELMLENALLRQQLIVVTRQVKRLQLSWRERGIMVLLASKLQGWKEALFIVQPDTLLRCIGIGFAGCGDASRARKSGADVVHCLGP